MTSQMSSLLKKRDLATWGVNSQKEKPRLLKNVSMMYTFFFHCMEFFFFFFLVVLGDNYINFDLSDLWSVYVNRMEKYGF